MTARIVVQTGSSAGTVFWIHQPVIRLGSDPSMDLCLPSPDLEPHVMTIEFRSKDYRVYNRGTQSFFMAEQCLSSGQSHIWLETDLLELPDGQQLAIELDDDPSPAPALHSYDAISGIADEPRQVDPDSSQSKSLSKDSRSSAYSLQGNDSLAATRTKSSAKSGQLLVIAFCLVLGGFLLLRHQFNANSSTAIAAPEFEEVIRAALNAEQSVPQTLIGQLQHAEAAVAAGNRSTAFDRYSRLRDSLLAMRQDPVRTPESTEGSEQTFQHILLLVEHRLGQLAN